MFQYFGMPPSHAMHMLDYADESYPTVYSVRCHTLVHCNLSCAVVKIDFIFHTFAIGISCGVSPSLGGHE